MHLHKTRCLKGPITQEKDWWPRSTSDEIPSLDDPEIRADLVRRVRQEIAAGTYDTPERLEQALHRLLSELRG